MCHQGLVEWAISGHMIPQLSYRVATSDLNDWLTDYLRNFVNNAHDDR